MFNSSKCILPYKDGTIYSILNTKQLLYPGYNVNQNELVNEDCETGYHKVDRLRIMKCIENGQWETYVNDKLCLSKSVLYYFIIMVFFKKIKY